MRLALTNAVISFFGKSIKLKYNFVKTPRKFTIAKLSIRGLGLINLRGVSTKLYSNLIFTLQTFKEFIVIKVTFYVTRIKLHCSNADKERA